MTVTETAAQIVPLDDAVAIGETELHDHDNIGKLTTRTRELYTRIQGTCSDAAEHYYRKIGYSPTDAAELLDFVHRFLALCAAADELGYPHMLSLPDRADSDGWHGLLIQTRVYQNICERLGSFVHHSTTERAQGGAVTRTLALLTRTFGALGTPAWADCPGCIIYGWCSDD